MTEAECWKRGGIERRCLTLNPLRDTMRKRGISELELARKVGVKVDVIRRSYWYHDEISLSLIEKICDALDCDIDEVMVADKVLYIPAHVNGPDEPNH